MGASLLQRVGRSADAIARLPDATRLEIVRSLLDWGAVDDALAILSLTGTDASDESHLAAATALRRSGRPAEARELIVPLMARVPTIATQMEYVRVLAAEGQADEALAAAERLAGSKRYALEGYLLQGEIHLARHDAPRADLAFSLAQRQDGSDPGGLIGRLRAGMLAQDRAITRLLLAELARFPGGMAALRNDELQYLRAATLFAEVPEVANALSAIDQLLVRRFDEALPQMQAVASGGKTRTQGAKRPLSRIAAPVQNPQPPASVGALPPVSRREQATMAQGARDLFGHAALMPLQAEVIAATLRGEDVLAVLPTGGGKSLCYQLPAWLDKGTTLAISPLLALMKDQLDSLPARLRSQAVALNSALQGDDYKAAMAGIAEGRFRLVFCAPERLRQRSLVAIFQTLGIARLVIDEAHCISAWGHDFRPDYLHLTQVHADLGAPPLLALTATAPPSVRTDILKQLFEASARSGRKIQQVVGNPGRPNLWLGALPMRDDTQREERIAALCQTIPGSGIVYVRSRARADGMAALLRERGLAASAYHAGMNNREQIQERFAAGALQVVVATVAFGMGVNKSDIRFVIHCGLPDSIDAYLQETGRAGRDGKSAVCMLYYTDRDLDAQTHFAQRESTDTTTLLQLYESIVRAAGDSRTVTLRLEQEAQRLGADETALRVALSTLEEANLIVRDYDVPRTVSLYLRKALKGSVFQRFASAAHVRAGTPAQWAWHELCDATQIAPDRLEQRLLDWQRQGALNYYGSGREMLLHLRALRSDPTARLEALLVQRSKARQQRAADILRFVQSGRCRHALLAEYSSVPAVERCNWCDNCGVPLTRLLAKR